MTRRFVTGEVIKVPPPRIFESINPSPAEADGGGTLGSLGTKLAFTGADGGGTLGSLGANLALTGADGGGTLGSLGTNLAFADGAGATVSSIAFGTTAGRILGVGRNFAGGGGFTDLKRPNFGTDVVALGIVGPGGGVGGVGTIGSGGVETKDSLELSADCARSLLDLLGLGAAAEEDDVSLSWAWTS